MNMSEFPSLGFTGTKRGLTANQEHVLRTVMKTMREHHLGPRTFHFGDCDGADREAFQMAMYNGYLTVAHPPTDSTHRAYCKAHHVECRYAYMTRNQHIVNASDFLVACPNTMQEVMRSGTWATVRRARTKKIAIGIIWPDGSRTYEGI